MDIKAYANTLIDQLISIKDNHRDVLTFEEIDYINDACNLISKNIERLEEE